MKILISGASGFIGHLLAEHLKNKHDVFFLVRQKEKIDAHHIFWDVETLTIESNEDFDVVINLSGENVGSGRWSSAKKKAILNSRINATKTLARFFSLKKNPPGTVINASAIGYYGSRSDEILTEESSKGTGFLADVCEEWEKALLPIKDRNVRTVFLRTGVVLGKEGGVIKRLMIPFKLYLGGIVGDGRQYMSWVDVDDVVRGIDYIIDHPDIDGPVNIVSPNPVTNQVFTDTFAKALDRPALFPIPQSIVKIIFGQMGEELLLSSQKAVPKKLLNAGFQFRYPEIEQSIKRILQ